MGLKIKRNEESEEHAEEYEFYQDSYRGGHEYREGDYLDKHELETKASFDKRKRFATYVNMCAPVVDTYTAYIFREQIVRDIKGIPQEVIDMYMADADMEGRTHERVAREISKHAGIFGLMGVVVDKPNGTATSRAEELAQDLRPYVAAYNPDKIIDWEYTRVNGRPTLTYLVLEDGKEGKATLYKVWTPDNWVLYKQEKDKEAEEIDSGINPLGRIPFVPVKNRDAFERMAGVSDIGDIAGINRRMYNFDSNADEIIKKTAFPFLEAPYDENSNDETETIGTSNVLDRPEGDTTGHRWVEPNHASLDRILTWRRECKEDIINIAKTGSSEATKTQVESGVALELRFQMLNAILADKAENMEDAEIAIFTLIAEWEGVEFTGEIKYPRKFGVRDLSFDLDQALKAEGLVPSRTFQSEQAMDIAERMMKDKSPAIMKAIEKELKEKPEPKDTVPDMGEDFNVDPDGDPTEDQNGGPAGQVVA